MTRKEVLKKAEDIVSLDRNFQYGEPEDNFSMIAKYWTTYLDMRILSTDVANMMCLFKLARIQANKEHEDSYVDIAGYIACAAEIATRGRIDNDNF